MEQPKRTRMTAKQKQAHRKAQFTYKKQNAMANLAAKVAMLGDEALLDEFEFAAYVSKSVQWARLKRIRGGGFPYIKIGPSVRYRFGAIKEGAAQTAE